MAEDALWASYIPKSDRTSSVSADSVTRSSRSNDALDKNAFLKLLITQMQYQDPLSPVDDKEFIAQMAQFSALEQMQNLNTTFAKSQAYSLVGKYADANLYNQQTGTTTQVIGKVAAVTMKSGEPYLVIDENGVSKEVPLSDVVSIADDPITSALNEASAINQYLAQNIALIGKNVQAIMMDAEKNITGFVEGKVEEVKMAGKNPVLIVNGKEVLLSEVISVSENNLLMDKRVYYYDTNNNLTYGKVTDLLVTNDSATLVVTNEESNPPVAGIKIPIEKIDAVSDALKYVDKNITQGTVTGVVEYVVIRNMLPYLVIDGNEVAYSAADIKINR